MEEEEQSLCSHCDHHRRQEFKSWGLLQDARRTFEEGRGSFWDIPAPIQAPGLQCTSSEIRGKSKAGAAQPFLGEREMMSSVFPITT